MRDKQGGSERWNVYRFRISVVSDTQAIVAPTEEAARKALADMAGDLLLSEVVSTDPGPTLDEVEALRLRGQAFTDGNR